MYKSSLKVTLFSAACLFAFANGTAHATNGYAPHGLGTKSKGLAGAGSALPQETLSMATNPAGIVYLGNRADAGLAIFSPRREYTVTGNPSGSPGSFPLLPGTVESDSDYFFVPNIGFTRKINDNSSWGVALYGNGGMNTDYPAFTNAFCEQLGGGNGSFCAGSAGINLEQLFVTPTYAQKFAGGNAAFGASLILAYQRFEATGIETFGGFSSDATKLSGNGVDTSAGVGARISVMGQVTPEVTIAASFQPKISMGEFDDYAGLFAGQGNFDIPTNYTLGLAWNTSTRSTLTFDIQQINFSEVDSVGNSIAELNPGGNPFGSDSGPGFGWDDMTVFKLGYQWNINPDWIWRVGLSHGEQPISDSEVTLNVLAPAVIEDHFTAGFTKLIGSANELSFAAMYAPSSKVKGPNAFDPTQNVEIEMSQFDLELSYAWKF